VEDHGKHQSVYLRGVYSSERANVVKRFAAV